MFHKILILVDEHPASMQAVRQGVEVARVNGSEILFFHLLPHFPSLQVGMQDAVVPLPNGYEQTMRENASHLLQQASALAEAAGVPSRRSMGSGVGGSEAQWVSDVATKRHCELIVVGSESRNAVVRLIGGSIVPGLISSAKVPVLVCQAREPGRKGLRRRALSQPQSPSQPKTQTAHIN